MGGVQIETEVGAELPGEGSEHRRRHLDDGAACLAHEVLVGIAGEVIHGSPVAEMDVVDESQLLEIVEDAVDRRLMDVRVRRLYALSDVVGGDVGVGLDQRGDDRATGRRDPAAARAELIEDRVELGGRHCG